MKKVTIKLISYEAADIVLEGESFTVDYDTDWSTGEKQAVVIKSDTEAVEIPYREVQSIRMSR